MFTNCQEIANKLKYIFIDSLCQRDWLKSQSGESRGSRPTQAIRRACAIWSFFPFALSLLYT